MGEIHLVRHGQASFGADDYDRLSPLGVEQAERLGAAFRAAGIVPDLLVTGRLRRHRETAAAAFPGVATREEGAFDEADFGALVRRRRPDLADPVSLRRFLAEEPDAIHRFDAAFFGAFAAWASGEHEGEGATPDGVPSWADFRARVVAGLRAVVEGRRSQTVVIVTSGGPIAAATLTALGLSDAAAETIARPLLNAGVTRLRHDDRRLSLRSFNAVGHLDGDGGRLLTHR